MRPTPDEILEGLDPEQRQVALALTGPVVVLAGAGTGKTRAITSRIAYGVASGVYVPQSVLAVTFTARAAGEMRSRLRGLGAEGVQARTFHSAALRQLQYFWPRAVGGELPTIAAHKAPLVAEAASRLRFPTDRSAVRDLSAEVEWAKVSQVSAEDYPAAAARAGRVPPAGLDAASTARLLSTYDEAKRARGLIDFEDVLVLMVGLLADDRTVADAVRRQYSRFVVDEYQDVNPLQQSLLDLWLGGRDEVCVVGDPSQTIYSFTGASPEHLMGFRRRHPHATEVRLVRDYRSTPQVVAAANAVLSRATGPKDQRLQLVAQRPAGPEVRYLEHADEAAEADAVAREAARLVASGLRASEIAVLFRTNAQSEAYESALAEASVPYVLRGGERFFERREVREAHLLLRGAARSGSGADPAGEAARAVLSSTGWSSEAPRGAGAVRERWESLSAIVRLADELPGGATLDALVVELDERASAQHAPTVEGVTLASLHAAKGLEWDAVFVVGLVEGLLPISFADTPEAVEEERRLLYVGLTRAREHLVLSWSRARGRRPSRFLDGLRPETRSASTGAGGSGSGRRALATTCSSCGRPLGSPAERKTGRCDDCPPAYDEAVFERLRAWRAAQAKEQSLPAYVVFTDATLAQIAEALPADERAMSRVSGVGATKLAKYGADVLAIVRGAEPSEISR
ncbi:DNA helicase-2/ATP-dependent DNA helicase PcrA [Motilibacter peucedani]|uniref:DNA 3'-5' helicase n=1 Tax=Motilibacter peucedani TaxID=598650 RepID=A0A420XML8_9ACTN|nr:ATP-dependent DNA helicase UvrD2 [Motilibacter peucedani]RKS72519.1 DNA helicase-2/ATP-dependent DNA helicase PcrA [Motilibacter peucedani]